MSRGRAHASDTCSTAFVALMMPTTTIANAQLVPTCFGRGATYVGTAGDDYIYKRTSGIDVWVFLGGDDYMDDEDHGGQDFVCSGFR